MFQRIEPPASIRSIVDCFWTLRSDNSERAIRKIVPDGYPEFIIHLGDRYEINLGRRWRVQSDLLFAGQATKYFFLRNTGISDVVGIKMNPRAVSLLFDIDMQRFTDSVVSMGSQRTMRVLAKTLSETTSARQAISRATEYFASVDRSKFDADGPVAKALASIINSCGQLKVEKMAQEACLSERQLFNVFKKQIGVSPKIYARIIRLSSIFQLMEREGKAWQGAAFDLSFFDHSHFIKDFKTFTGENPSAYPFEEQNLANFFLQRR